MGENQGKQEEIGILRYLVIKYDLYDCCARDKVIGATFESSHKNLGQRRKSKQYAFFEKSPVYFKK